MKHKKEVDIEKAEKRVIKYVDNIILNQYEEIKLGSVGMFCSAEAMIKYLECFSLNKVPREYTEVVRVRLVCITLTILLRNVEEDYYKLLKKLSTK